MFEFNVSDKVVDIVEALLVAKSLLLIGWFVVWFSKASGDGGDGTGATEPRLTEATDDEENEGFSLRKRDKRTFLDKHSFKLSVLFSVIVAGGMMLRRW